ncbi:MAG: helix-turn-helix domain-containing protein [Candidatus Binataceae bacterium]
MKRTIEMPAPPVNHSALELMRHLDARRKALGMSVRLVARESGIGMRTAQRLLSGKEPSVRFDTLLSIADALKVRLRAVDIGPAHAVRAAQARRKAAGLAAMVQGTSALEAQAVPPKALREIQGEIAADLLGGSRRRLWA